MARYTVPGAYGITRKSYEELDELISSLRMGTRQFDKAMNVATRLMAHTTQGFALRYMSGPDAPSRGGSTYQPSTWSIPVRRITGRTRAGWRVRRISHGAWEVFNEERGARMVEFGIVAGGGGTKRPILKMSGVATLRFIQRTRFAQRMMADTFGDLRNNKGQFRKFEDRIRPFELMMAGRRVVGPQGRIPR
jgi:hypothetical protein